MLSYPHTSQVYTRGDTVACALSIGRSQSLAHGGRDARLETRHATATEESLAGRVDPDSVLRHGAGIQNARALVRSLALGGVGGKAVDDEGVAGGEGRRQAGGAGDGGGLGSQRGLALDDLCPARQGWSRPPPHTIRTKDAAAAAAGGGGGGDGVRAAKESGESGVGNGGCRRGKSLLVSGGVGEGLGRGLSWCGREGGEQETATWRRLHRLYTAFEIFQDPSLVRCIVRGWEEREAFFLALAHSPSITSILSLPLSRLLLAPLNYYWHPYTQPSALSLIRSVSVSEGWHDLSKTALPLTVIHNPLMAPSRTLSPPLRFQGIIKP